MPTSQRKPKGERKRAFKTPLHVALEANDVEAAAALIDTADRGALNSVSATGTTPLMLLAMGRCSTRRSKSRAESLIYRLLERGGAEGIALRSSGGRSAADYAETPGRLSAPLLQHLRELEARALELTADERCRDCLAPLQPSRECALAKAAQRAARGEETNGALCTFFMSGRHSALLHPAFHRIAQLRTVRKEISESLGILAALDAALPAIAVAHSPDDASRSLPGPLHLVDLCCGMGLTATLAAQRYSGRVTAIDVREPSQMPHWASAGCAVSFVQCDLLTPRFLTVMCVSWDRTESTRQLESNRVHASAGIELSPCVSWNRAGRLCVSWNRAGRLCVSWNRACSGRVG